APGAKSISSVLGYEEPIVLTQSTHSFLFTEPTCSKAFAFALAIVSISYVCLLLALFNNTLESGSAKNKFGVPVNVPVPVKIAQFLALIIGIIMEEEIPEASYLLRMLNRESLARGGSIKYRRFIFCAVLRIVMGYLFLFNLFIVVVQAKDVINIFFDAMALQFLEQIDDIAFNLAKKDVFGKRLKRAATRKCFRTEFAKMPFARRKKMSIFVQVMYCVNLCAMIGTLCLISFKQVKGDYNCDSITVTFDDHTWQNALVVNDTESIERRTLVYSYFNGVYRRIGTSDGRPRYTEQNKFDDSKYNDKIGATIRYCQSERACELSQMPIRTFPVDLLTISASL
ncbi:hypothetical protein ACHAWF_013504, partial [Thalassiosira exigua]